MESRRSMHRPPLPQLPPRCPHRPCSGCKTQPRKKPSSDLQTERGRDIRILAPCTVAPERKLRRCSPGLPPRKAKDSHGPWGAPLRRGPKLAQTAPVPPAAPAAPHPAGPPDLPLEPRSGERPPPPRLRRPAPRLWSRSLVKVLWWCFGARESTARPLGPLGFNFSQHGPTTRPSVKRTAEKA